MFGSSDMEHRKYRLLSLSISVIGDSHDQRYAEVK